MRGRLVKTGVFLLSVGILTIVLSGAVYLSLPRGLCTGLCSSDYAIWGYVLMSGGTLASLGAASSAYGMLNKRSRT